MKKLLIVALLCVGLVGMSAPAQASEPPDTITIEWDGEPIQCTKAHLVQHTMDVVQSPYYYIIHYAPYGIFWIVLGAEDTVRCLEIPV